MIMRETRSITAIVLMLCLTACGGGGGSTSAIPSKNVPSSTAASGNAVMSITIPAKIGTAGNKRRPQWVSSAAMGIDVSVSQNGLNAGESEISVAPGAPNCTPGSGQRTCTVTFGIVPGLDSITVTLWDEVPPFDNNGSPLAQATVTQSVSPNVTANFNVTLNGLVAFLDPNASGPFTPALPAFIAGTPGSQSTQWTAYDIDTEPIPGNFANPVPLFTDDTTHGLSISPTTLTTNGPGTVAYNGNSLTATSLISTCDLHGLTNYFLNCVNYDGEEVITVKPPSGSIYTSDAGGAPIVGFNPFAFGNQSPIRNLGVTSAAGIAISNSGTLWAALPGYAKAHSFRAGVSVTSPLTLAMGQNVLDTRFKNVAGAGIAAGNTYFADPVNNVIYQGVNTPCPPCSWSLNVMTAPGVNAPLGMVGVGSQLYVVNSGNQSITKYNVSGTSTTATLVQTVTSTALHSPKGIAADATGDIFVADTAATGGPSVLIFASGAGAGATPVNTVTTGLTSIFGVAVDSTQAIWVSGMNAAGPVLEKYTSSTPPSAPYTLAGTISGSNTGLSNPTYLAVSP